MSDVIVFGSGNIGSTIALLLSNFYSVTICDCSDSVYQIEKQNPKSITSQLICNLNDIDLKFLDNLIKQHSLIVNALPYHLNSILIDASVRTDTHYIDLSEDVFSMQKVRECSQLASSIFAPGCGLAPGLIGFQAAAILKDNCLNDVAMVGLRVGSIPVDSSLPLGYSLNWSIDGLVNEYLKPSYVISNGKHVTVDSLTGLEELTFKTEKLEAFYTSGGVGTFADWAKNKNISIGELNYKTIRYPGHCSAMLVLFDSLKLRNKPEKVKNILQDCIPSHKEDRVVTQIKIVKNNNEVILMNNDYRGYEFEVSGVKKHINAIQATTALSACNVVDLILSGKIKKNGLLLNEDISYFDFINARFGNYFMRHNCCI